MPQKTVPVLVSKLKRVLLIRSYLPENQKTEYVIRRTAVRLPSALNTAMRKNGSPFETPFPTMLTSSSR